MRRKSRVVATARQTFTCLQPWRPLQTTVQNQTWSISKQSWQQHLLGRPLTMMFFNFLAFGANARLEHWCRKSKSAVIVFVSSALKAVGKNPTLVTVCHLPTSQCLLLPCLDRAMPFWQLCHVAQDTAPSRHYTAAGQHVHTCS